MTNTEAVVPGVCPVHLPSHSPAHWHTNRCVHADTRVVSMHALTYSTRTLALPLSSLSLFSRWWGVRLVGPPPNSKPPAHHPLFRPPPPSENHPARLCAVAEPECWKASLSLSPPPTNPWLAAIGGTQSGVLMLQLGEETLVNLPIACHWPWPGLFVSGTPLISPSTPSSVFPPYLPTQFLYQKTVSSFLKDLPLCLSRWDHILYKIQLVHLPAILSDEWDLFVVGICRYTLKKQKQKITQNCWLILGLWYTCVWTLQDNLLYSSYYNFLYFSSGVMWIIMLFIACHELRAFLPLLHFS